MDIIEKAIDSLKYAAGKIERGHLDQATVTLDETIKALQTFQAKGSGYEPFGYVILNSHYGSEDFTRITPDKVCDVSEIVIPVFTCAIPVGHAVGSLQAVSDVDAMLADVQQAIKGGDSQRADMYLQAVRIHMSRSVQATKENGE